MPSKMSIINERIVCSVCGSEDIEMVHWVNPNTKEIHELFGSFGESDTSWCHKCDDHVRMKVIMERDESSRSPGRPSTHEETCKFIHFWSLWFYNGTSTYSGAIGRQLAYLWPAIVDGNRIEVAKNSAIVQLLRNHGVSEKDAIWSYMDLV